MLYSLYHSDIKEYKDDKPADKSAEVIYKRENENINDKTVSGDDEDLENGQNQQKKSKSDDERSVKTITREKNLASL